MAGVMLIIMGFGRRGSVIKFILNSLIIVFTNGIAICIFFYQIKDFFGLKMGVVPVDFLDKWKAILKVLRQ
jgi:SulP family sulfate permease